MTIRALLLTSSLSAAFALFAGDPATYPVGSTVRLPTGIDPTTPGFCAWKLMAYEKDAPAAFKAQHLDAYTPPARTDPGFGVIALKPYVWTKTPPAEIDVDTTGWPVGDYRLTVGTFVRRDGKDVYGGVPVSFTLKDEVRRSPEGGADEIPFVSGFNGDPRGAAKVDVPWRSDFSVVRTHAQPAAATKFKVFQDGNWLYFAVAASEPEKMEAIRAMPKVGYGHYLISDYDRDSIEVNVDPTGTGLRLYKAIVNPTGDAVDFRGDDDNTDTGRFSFSRQWRSHARIETSYGEKGWLVEIALPFGAMDDADPDAKWAVSVGRQRHTGSREKRNRACEQTLSCPAKTLVDAAQFPRFALAKAAKAAHRWDVPGVKTATVAKDGRLSLVVEMTVYNRTGDFRDTTIRATLEDKHGKTVARTKTRQTFESGPLRSVALEIADAPKGDALLRIVFVNANGAVEKQIYREVRVEYEPVRIRLVRPAYRDCVFESMNLTELAGEVALEEGLGRPLTVRLTGPGTDEKVVIPCAAAVNPFRFAFAGKAKGDYLLTAGRATKRVRNLPFQAGEIWFDGDGVAYREGKKMMPFGFFTERYRDRTPGINIAQMYAHHFTNEAQLVEQCRKARANGCGFIVSPFQNLSEVPFETLFGKAAAQGEFGKGRHGDAQKRSVARFVNAVKGEPGFFAYYLVDEPEGRGLNPDFFVAAREYITGLDPYHPTIMLNYSIDGIRRYHEGGDILCPDAYPIYYTDGGVKDPKRCSYDKAKAASSYGPAWLTPAAFDWDVLDGDRMPCGPTYAQLREQHLMGLAGDARGFLLYDRFTNVPGGYDIQLGYKFVLEEIAEAQDAFLAPSRPLRTKVVPEKSSVFAALKRAGDDTLVIVVNSDRAARTLEIAGAELPSRLYLGGVKEPVAAKDGRLVLELKPYESRVYRSKPWKFSPTAAQAAVDAAEAGRRKPGNLCVTGHFRTWHELRRDKLGRKSFGYPHFTASSIGKVVYDLYSPYYLQDGIAEGFPYLEYHSWGPAAEDRKPWVRCDFGGKRRFSKIVLTRQRNAKGHYFLTDCTVEANGKTVATCGAWQGDRAVLTFPAVEADSFTIRIGRFEYARWDGLLTEVEAYAE